MDETIKKDKNYDFLTPVEQEATELAKFLIAAIDENKDFLLIESYENADPIVKAAFQEKSTDFAISYMSQLSKSSIPYPYATRSIDKISVLLESLKKYIEGTIEQNRHELASRVLRVRSPQNGKWTEEMAPYGQLLLKLSEARTATDATPGDYFDDPNAVKENPTEKNVELSEEQKKELGLSTDGGENQGVATEPAK